jgi:hypothetical protein
MKAISTFRFTSPHKKLIDQLAGLYGGEVVPWDGGKQAGQWETITEANSIPIILPRDAIDSWYELWSGGGLQRRCNGMEVNVPIDGPDGPEPSMSPCICAAKQKVECEELTRMNMFLPGVDFAGTWRLETKSFHAGKELPSMIRIIETMTEGGRMVQAELSVQPRTSVRFGKTKKFVVPVISLPYTPEQMLSGGAEVVALPMTPRLELVQGGLGDPKPLNAQVALGPTPDVDDEVVDAIVVEENGIMESFSETLHGIAERKQLDYGQLWPAIKRQVGYTEGAPTEEQHERIHKALTGLADGSLQVRGFNADGTAIWQRVS